MFGYDEKYEIKALSGEIESLRNELQTLKKEHSGYLENQNSISFISQTALKLLESYSDRELFKFITERIYSISEGAIVSFSEYDHLSRKIIVREIRSTPQEREEMKKMFGSDPEGYSFNFPDEIRNRIKPGNLELISGFHELVFGQLPEDFCSEYERRLQLGKIFAMVCSTEDDILGTISIMTHSNEPWPKNRVVIESIVSQAALALKRIRSERSHLESEERYRQVAELANSIIIRWNRNGTITYVNDYGLKFFDYSKEELLGKDIGMLVPEEESSGRNLKSLCNDIMNDPEKYNFSENENILRNRNHVWVRWANRAIKDENGEIQEILAIGYDISRIREAEEMLKTEHNLLDAVINNAGIGFFVTEANGNIVLFNDIALKIHELKINNNKSLNLRDYLKNFKIEYPDGTEIPMDKWPFSMAVRGEFVRNLEVRIIRLASMTSRMIRVNSIPVYGNFSKLKLIVFTLNDFTEVYNNTAALRETQQRYESLFNNATLAIQQCKIIIDDNGKPVDFEMFKINNTYTRVTGLTRQMVKDRKATEIFPGIERAAFDFIGNFGKVALEGGEMNEEVYFDPLDKWVSIYAYSPKKGEFTAFLSDISSRKQAEAELKKAKEKAEESDRLKSAFLANMSHEIRTPMNGILGFSDLLKNPGLSGESQRMYVEAINSSGKRMLSIINDLIDISRIEAGQTELRKSSVNLPGLLKEAILFFQPEAEKKGINLWLNIELQSDTFYFETDKTKLYQVISNLIKNALKFTNKNGSIEVGCRLTDEKAIFFYVKDTGIGIRKDLMEKIFERFRQGDSAEEHEGVGLGLTISRAFVELLGGSLGVESEAGKGSVFYFSIPYEKQTLPFSIETEKNTPHIISIEAKNILIAEDDDMSYLLLKEILNQLHVNVIRAINGEDALNIIGKNPSIDLVLMDLKMPVMDGLEATSRIKNTYPVIPVIIQSAYAGQEEIEKSFHAGADYYITKPIDSKKFLSKVAEIISL
jgi:PAS domain S-box-containing protein